MLVELKAQEFEKARWLFQGLDYSLSIRATIEGNNPGRIFVDDVLHPHTAFALTVEGYLLAGDCDNPVTLQALQRFLQEKIFTGEVYVGGDESMCLAVHPETWEARLPGLIPTHEVEKLERYHYLCRELAFGWRSNLPEGYRVRRMDRSLLTDPNVVVPDQIADWVTIEDCWGTVDNFLARGIGFCVLQGNQVVSRCLADCMVGEQIDVGIITHSAHRRKGLAAIAAAATVEHCLGHGFSAVGWHCDADNIGSWRTAEKVGFKRNREYIYYYYMYDPIDHLAELGWYYFKRGEREKTVRYYEQVFSQRSDNPDYYYHLAALAWAGLGNKESALKYLSEAADRGWRHVEWTKQHKEFTILHDLPEWEMVLRRMASGD